MKNIYYNGKLYKVKDWDFETKRPKKKDKPVEIEPVIELEKPLEADLEA